jgi:hypothetical protein
MGVRSDDCVSKCLAFRANFACKQISRGLPSVHNTGFPNTTAASEASVVFLFALEGGKEEAGMQTITLKEEALMALNASEVRLAKARSAIEAFAYEHGLENALIVPAIDFEEAAALRQSLERQLLVLRVEEDEAQRVFTKALRDWSEFQ